MAPGKQQKKVTSRRDKPRVRSKKQPSTARRAWQELGVEHSGVTGIINSQQTINVIQQQAESRRTHIVPTTIVSFYTYLVFLYTIVSTCITVIRLLVYYVNTSFCLLGRTTKFGQKPRKKRFQCKRENLEEALAEYEGGGRPIRELARAYFVPETTLRDGIKSHVEVDAVVDQKPILTDEEEVKLEDYLLKCCEKRVGKTKQQVKQMAFALVKRAPQGRNQTIVQKWLDHEKAGDDWYYIYVYVPTP